MKKKFFQTMGIFALLILGGGTFVHAQSGGGAPPVPVYVNTGNPAADQAAYESSKVAYTSFFAPATPVSAATYEAAKKETAEAAAAAELAAKIAEKAALAADTREFISQEAWDAADTDKRDYLDAHPAEFNLSSIVR